MQVNDPPEVNQVYERLDADGVVVGLERVLYILPGAEAWMVIRLPLEAEPKRSGRGKRDLPHKRSRDEHDAEVEAGTLRVLAEDPYEDTTVPAKEGPGSKHRKRLEKNWLLIEKIVANPTSLFSETRGPLIAEAAKSSGRQKAEIYDYCIRFWQRGQVAGSIKPLYFRNEGERQEVEVANNKRGRPRTGSDDGQAVPSGIAIGKEARSKILKGIKAYRVKGRMSLRIAYRRTLQRFWSRKEPGPDPLAASLLLPLAQLPTWHQFCYVWNKFRKSNASWVKRHMVGEKGFNLVERLLMDSPERAVSAPGEAFEIDAHRADYELVHSITRLPIGPPTIYLVVDVFSHLIVGLNVTLEAPSYIAAAMALMNAFCPKVEYCRQHNVDINPGQWPSQHLCKDLRADRGELLGTKADTVENTLGVAIVNLPSYRPDMKGLIERCFKRLNEKLLCLLPGAIQRPKERGKRNPKHDAVLDLSQFTTIIIRVICQLNSEVMQSYQPDRPMLADNVSLTPLSIWNWGIKNRSGKLRQRSPQFIKSNLLPRAFGRVTRDGLEFDGFVYSRPPELSEDWQFAAAGGENKVEVAYDPRSVDAVFLCNRDGSVKGDAPFPLRERFKAHLGCSWREVQLVRRDRLKKRAESDSAELEQQVRDDVEFDRIVREAEAKRKAAVGKNVPKSALTSNISANREDDLRKERQSKQSFQDSSPKETAPDALPAEPSSAPPKVIPFVDESPAQARAERLKRLFDQK